MGLHITGGSIITPRGPEPADLGVSGGKVTAVAAPCGLPPNTAVETFDATGLWLLPGAIDAHTHFGMPLGSGISSLGWRESSEAALLGGTTTVIDFVNPQPGEPLPDAVARWRRSADGACLCDYGLHCTVSEALPERLAEIPALVGVGIPTFKGFLAYKGRLMLTPEQMKALMHDVRRAGGMLLVHAEDGEVNAAAQEVLVNTGRTTANWHPAAHPPESEISAVKTALALAAETDCPLTIVHMSLAESLAELDKARPAAAAAVYGEVCLHHLAADASLYGMGQDRALAAICSPPLRSAADAAGLLAGLADGRIDFLSTDHCEFPLETKRLAARGGFGAVPNGCGGVGERLTFAYTLGVVSGAMSPWRWMQVCCQKPAEIMGLTGRKGRLHPGHDADIVAFDPLQEFRWDALGASDGPGNLYRGRTARGRVVQVWKSGRLAVTEGRVVTGTAGSFLPRRLSHPQAI
ncbi:hypothetical protein COW53_09875 [bacterium CG17_big_fil_post_rev_8_21_14_2_50_64_8]|nr:MAG: hypothetical protein COW53_09875 [bacterium CG17_big_fil_post_rev_8_21_14_2_50_64_8]